MTDESLISKPTEIESSAITIRPIDPRELISNIDLYAAEIAAIASEGFGMERNPKAIRGRLEHERFVLLAEEHNQPVGFQFQSIHEIADQRYLYFSRVVKKDQQSQGLGRRLLNTAVEFYQPTVMGARTQNPAALNSFLRTMTARGVATIYPFITEEEKYAQAGTLEEFLRIVGFADKVDRDTGLCRQAYKGRLGDYEVRTDNPRIKDLETYFQQIGLVREDGDALFYFARLSPGLT